MITEIPSTESLPQLREAALDCRNCPLWKNATQTVFGDGASSAKLMIVGEQPGDQEDQEGLPFVGPAGQLLAKAMEEAGITRAECYVTNAVKHFKWEPRGKRRLHKKPSAREVSACRPWLEAELHAIQPDVLVCLGATAAASILGSQVRVLRDRGKKLPSNLAKAVFVTIHPSLLLRMPDREAAKKEYRRLVRDLRSAAAAAP